MSAQDGNGNISRSELRHVMMNMGEKISEEECSYLVEVTGLLYLVIAISIQSRHVSHV